MNQRRKSCDCPRSISAPSLRHASFEVISSSSSAFDSVGGGWREDRGVGWRSLRSSEGGVLAVSMLWYTLSPMRSVWQPLTVPDDKPWISVISVKLIYMNDYFSFLDIHLWDTQFSILPLFLWILKNSLHALVKLYLLWQNALQFWVEMFDSDCIV